MRVMERIKREEKSEGVGGQSAPRRVVFVTGGMGGLITAYLAYVRLFAHQSIGDRPLLLLGVMLVFIGVQLVTFGLLAEVMARTYYESQDKPTYVIREIREAAAELAQAGSGRPA